MAIGRVSTMLPSITGRLENFVYVTNKNGRTVIREYVIPNNPRTPAQVKARNNMGTVSQLWRELTDAQRKAWEDYAEPQGRVGYRAFVGLATKWRRINGNGTPPSMPPTDAFFGDSVGLSVTVGAVGSGTVVFAAQRPNQPGVMVEIRVQRLIAAHRKTKPRDWVSKGFVAFTTDSLTHSLTLPKGAYAVGYRYVNAATGQETEMAVLSKVSV